MNKTFSAFVRRMMARAKHVRMIEKIISSTQPSASNVLVDPGYVQSAEGWETCDEATIREGYWHI